MVDNVEEEEGQVKSETEKKPTLNRLLYGKNEKSGIPTSIKSRVSEIERKVVWKNVNTNKTSEDDTKSENKQQQQHQRTLHEMVGSQNVKEKSQMNELNSRLDELVESIKLKKAENENLQLEINEFRSKVMNAEETNKLKQTYSSDLKEFKSELNNVSERSIIAKIRTSRSMYDLDRLRAQYDSELRQQSNDKEKIRKLESQRGESMHELSHLKESWEHHSKSFNEDIDKNQKLRERLKELQEK
jgi:chromosome segregation ATPase